MIGYNYWALPNMGKMHLMKLCDINNKSYTKTAGRYYFYKRNKKVQETFFVRKGESKVETRVKTKTKVLETHQYLQDAHNSSFEERENLINCLLYTSPSPRD